MKCIWLPFHQPLFLAPGGWSPLLPSADSLHPWQHSFGGLASSLHGHWHPGYRGSPRSPHNQTWICQSPAAADPGTQKDNFKRSPPCQQQRRLWARVPVHPKPGKWGISEFFESKANKGSPHGDLSVGLNKLQIVKAGFLSGDSPHMAL